MTEHTKAIFTAAQNGERETMCCLIESPVSNLVERDDYGNTALHYGVKSGNLEIVQYLTERIGFSPVTGNGDGETPWDIAWAEGQNDILDYFTNIMGYSYEESYHNPIRRGLFPDPSIVRVGEDYYMVNSSFVFFPCIPISHSRDLIHWEVIGHAITEPEYARLEDLHGGMGYWAPDISYCDGRFFVTATLRLNDGQEKKRLQMVTSSEKPEGPYDPPVFLDIDGIDPSIFHDDDGRKYMLVNKGARIVELSRDCRRMISPVTMLWYGDCKRKPEGPHMLKWNGYYYLFLAEGGTGKGHRITVARAKQLRGPYEPSPYNPILRQWDEHQQMQCCGHGKPFRMADGRWGIVYLCLRMLDGEYGILGRETALDPLEWTQDGWPVINGGRGPSQQQKLPVKWNPSQAPEPCRTPEPSQEPELCQTPEPRRTPEPSQAPEPQQTTLPEHWGGYPRWNSCIWMTPRPLPGDHIRLMDEEVAGETAKAPAKAPVQDNVQAPARESAKEPAHGTLCVLGNGEDLCSMDCRSVLVERQDHFRFHATCGFRIPSLKEGESLGLTCYYDENSYIKYGLGFRDGQYGIWLQEYVGDGYRNEMIFPLQTEKTEELTGRRIWCRVETDRLARTFSYCIEDEKKDGQRTPWVRTGVVKDTSYLSSEGLSKGKRFTGATVGIYVQGSFWGTFTEWEHRRIG